MIRVNLGATLRTFRALQLQRFRSRTSATRHCSTASSRRVTGGWTHAEGPDLLAHVWSRQRAGTAAGAWSAACWPRLAISARSRPASRCSPPCSPGLWRDWRRAWAPPSRCCGGNGRTSTRPDRLGTRRHPGWPTAATRAARAAGADAAGRALPAARPQAELRHRRPLRTQRRPRADRRPISRRMTWCATSSRAAIRRRCSMSSAAPGHRRWVRPAPGRRPAAARPRFPRPSPNWRNRRRSRSGATSLEWAGFDDASVQVLGHPGAGLERGLPRPADGHRAGTAAPLRAGGRARPSRRAAACLAPQRRHLQSAGLAVAPEQLQALADRLAALGVTRLSAIGHMTCRRRAGTTTAAEPARPGDAGRPGGLGRGTGGKTHEL